jgi:hypothetical protein
MFSCLRVVSLTLMISVMLPTIAQDDGKSPKVLHVKSSGNAEAWVHFDPALLIKYSLDGSDLAKSAASILDFQAATWSFPGPVAWDVYIAPLTEVPYALGTNEYSATEKMAGATKPPPLSCVTRIGLQNIERNIFSVNPRNGMPIEEPFSLRVAYTMAHEATHCYQWVTSKVHKETSENGTYPGATWLTEGVAHWLAGDYLESTGRPYPSYYEVGFRDHHRENLLTHTNTNHFFFKWLEGEQALKTRAAVLAFVTDMFEAPWPNQPSKDCVGSRACSTPLYQGLLKQWFLSRRNKSFATVLSVFGSAVVRGTVPGIRAPTLFLSRPRRTLQILPGFNKARMAILATGVPTPVPLGRIQAIPNQPSMKQFVPDSFGFAVFETRLSEELIPPPHGLLVAMEGGSDELSVHLSNEKSDTVVDQSGWVRTNFLEGQWFSVARTDAKAGQNARILLKALP